MGTYRPFPPSSSAVQSQSQSSFAPPPPLPPPPPPPPPNPNPNLTSSSTSTNPNPRPQHVNYGSYQSQSYGAGGYASQPSLPPPPYPPYQQSSLPPPPQQYFNQQQFNPPPLPPNDNFLRPPPPPPVQPPLPAPPPPLFSGTEKGRSGHPPRHHHQKSGGDNVQIGRAGGGISHGRSKVETEEERRVRKKREFEKQRHEEKKRHMLKESQAALLQKTQMMSTGGKQPLFGPSSTTAAGSRHIDRKSGVNPLLTRERVENRLYKPTTFLCKFKFMNELPDPTAQPKLMKMCTNRDQYTKYSITSLEKNYRPQLFVDRDLGIPLDLLDLSVYNPVGKPVTPLAPEDECLLQDDDFNTPAKHDGIKKKERPDDKGVHWLVKTQYISPLCMEAAKMSTTEKQAKEKKESKDVRNKFLETLNNREKQIQAIEESFRAAKLPPVHQMNRDLEAMEIIPFVPDLERYNDQFVMATFDGEPLADTEGYKGLDQEMRDECESRAIMKTYSRSGSDPNELDRFVEYMAPEPSELSKDIYEDGEESAYNWIRDYNYSVRGDEVDDPTTYLLRFEDGVAKYLPLPKKLTLQKKRKKEGRSGETERFPPSSITVRKAKSVIVHELMSQVKSSSVHVGESSQNGGVRRRKLSKMDASSPVYKKTQRMNDWEDDISD